MSRETDYNIFRAIRGARDEVCGAKRWGMVVAFLRNGVWLSHSYEKKKKKRPDLCCDREKRKDKMIFFFKKCEKNYFIVNQEPIKFDRLLCQQNVNTVTI